MPGGQTMESPGTGAKGGKGGRGKEDEEKGNEGKGGREKGRQTSSQGPSPLLIVINNRFI